MACKACKGRGVTSCGTCTSCVGNGTVLRNASFRKEDSGLKVAIDLRNTKHRQLLGRFLGSRIAGDRTTLHHSTKLMGFLINQDIPYATTEFKHPFFRRAAKIDWKPVNWNLFENVPWKDLPWSVRAGVQALGLGNKLNKLTLRKFANALRAGDPTIEQSTGRTAQEVIQELNDFLMNGGRSGHRVSSRETVQQILKRKRTARTKKRAKQLLTAGESEESGGGRYF